MTDWLVVAIIIAVALEGVHIAWGYWAYQELRRLRHQMNIVRDRFSEKGILLVDEVATHVRVPSRWEDEEEDGHYRPPRRPGVREQWIEET